MQEQPGTSADQAPVLREDPGFLTLKEAFLCAKAGSVRYNWNFILSVPPAVQTLLRYSQDSKRLRMLQEALNDEIRKDSSSAPPIHIEKNLHSMAGAAGISQYLEMRHVSAVTLTRRLNREQPIYSFLAAWHQCCSNTKGTSWDIFFLSPRVRTFFRDAIEREMEKLYASHGDKAPGRVEQSAALKRSAGSILQEIGVKYETFENFVGPLISASRNTPLLKAILARLQDEDLMRLRNAEGLFVLPRDTGQRVRLTLDE